MSRAFTYKWSDAWVLLAIVYAGRDGGATLADVVGAADAINHAILTYGELQNALYKLTADGLVRYEEGRLSPTTATMDFYRSASTKRRAMLSDLDDMRLFLGAEPWAPGPGQFRQEFTFPAVSREDFEAAVQRYLEWARKTIGPKRPGKRKKAPRS